jgi:MFS family permease
MAAPARSRGDEVRAAASAAPVFFGWRVVWAAFAIAMLAWGVGFYSPSEFLHVLHESRGWSVSLISSAITCHFLFSAGIVARLPMLHRRFGLAATTRAGGLAAGLGVLAWAMATQSWQLFPAALLSGAGWALTSGAAINSMVAPWFERRRPAALSIAFNGASIGGVLFAPLWALLIVYLGFPIAALCIGAIMVVTLWWLAGAYLSATPQALGLFPDGDAMGSASLAAKAVLIPSARLPAGSMIWRERRFATLSVAFSLGMFAQIGLIAHLFSLLAPALGEGGAGLAISLTTASAILGRSLLGALLPTGSDRRIAAALNFSVQIVGSVALLAAAGTSVPLLLVGCILFGLGIGNLVTLPPLIAQAEFAPGDVGRVVASVVAVNQAVFAFAPVTLGLLRDNAGWGGTPIALAALVQLVALVIVLTGRRRRTKKSSDGINGPLVEVLSAAKGGC